MRANSVRKHHGESVWLPFEHENKTYNNGYILSSSNKNKYKYNLNNFYII